jgi:hypothetical protein
MGNTTREIMTDGVQCVQEDETVLDAVNPLISSE